MTRADDDRRLLLEELKEEDLETLLPEAMPQTPVMRTHRRRKELRTHSRVTREEIIGTPPPIPPRAPKRSSS